MIARIPLLTGLLTAQLVVLALLLLVGEDDGEALALLSFEPAEVTGLTLEDGDGNRVSLQKLEGEWQVDGLPADDGKIVEVISSLAGGTASWPVATSDSSQTRFEVTETSFQRRIEFAADSGELATLYLGSSPGFRRIHAREADEAAIFSIDFGVHEVPVNASDWLDKQLLQVESISRLTFPEGAVLSGDAESGWALDGQPADPEAASRFVDRLKGLTVLGVHDASADPVLGEPATVLVEDNLGTHALTFRFNEAVDEYVLQSDRLPGEFTVASYIVEQILVPATELLPEEEAVAEPEGEPAEVNPSAAEEG